ncbi:MAG: TIGR03619 family F420-dependent LLM class oxidoreductase, partial [Actinomyces sp.]
MHLAFTTMNTATEVRPDLLARALEERGYEALFYGEHPQIPVARRTPYPAGGEMPDLYRHMMDPFVGLTLAASATRRLRLGTGVCLVLEHDPFVLAKTVASLDVVSGGRVLFGVGVGWNVEELAVHRPDLPWSRRHRAAADTVAALRALWTDEEASHEGTHVRFEPVWSFPKP